MKPGRRGVISFGLARIILYCNTFYIILDADAREKQVFNATNMLTNVLSTYTSSDLPTLKQWKIDWCLPFEKNEQYYVSTVFLFICW